MRYDIIIIGTGAGGGTIAQKLAPSGKKILILERGGFLPKEKENWDEKEVFTKGRYRTKEQWLDAKDNLFTPFTHYWVGGNTKMYGAALFRLRESDFKQVQHFSGISPEWALSYQDFEPYYSQAEKLYSAHGLQGIDPTEPKRQFPYPHPPLIYEPDMFEVEQQFIKQGLNPFPIPMGVRLNEKKFPTAPIHLSLFDGYPDLTEAKADSHVVGINGALEYENVTLLTNTKVNKLLTDEGGKIVTKVEAEIEGQTEYFEADLIIVSCGAVNSAALFLRSANDKHPTGLSNSSGLLGRNLMLHNNGCVLMISQKPNQSQFQKAFCITDYYENSPAGFPLGSIQLMGKNDLDTVKSLTENLNLKMTPEEISQHSIDFWITAEDLPDYNNRVSIGKDGNLQIHYTRNNRQAYELLKDKLKEILTNLGKEDELFRNPTFVGYDLDFSGVSHQNGTMKFGHDPKSSVLDVNCKAHELDNVYVVDGGFFASSGALNPSLTIMANALRVGEHLLQNVL